MYVPIHLHCVFEEVVYQVFPMFPIPKAEWENKWAFSFDAKRLLAGKTWPEVVGYRLNYGELDLSLSLWMKSLPLNVFHYYLPSHLIVASMMLRNIETNYPIYMMEALILPPSLETTILEELNDELSLEALITDYAEIRIQLYKMMSKKQRACVAQYLSLYLEYKKSSLTNRGMKLYLQNRDFWKNSSLQF